MQIPHYNRLPSRWHFNKPVICYSVDRCVPHNEAVDGAKNSQHTKSPCGAADIRIEMVPISELYAYVENLIGDRGGVGLYNGHVHLDLRGKRARWST